MAHGSELENELASIVVQRDHTPFELGRSDRSLGSLAQLAGQAAEVVAEQEADLEPGAARVDFRLEAELQRVVELVPHAWKVGERREELQGSRLAAGCESRVLHDLHQHRHHHHHSDPSFQIALQPSPRRGGRA